MDHALHLGLTEAYGSKGIVASTAALAVLLQEGIGDTFDFATPKPGGDRSLRFLLPKRSFRRWGFGVLRRRHVQVGQNHLNGLSRIS